MDEAQQSSKSPTVPYPRRPLYPDPETADMTEAERLAEYKQSAAYQARQVRYRQWEGQQAYLRYRQGEWADPQPIAQPKSLWQSIWDAITTTEQKVTSALVRTLSTQKTSSYKLATPAKNESQLLSRRGWPKWVPWVVEGVLLLTVPSVYIGMSSYYGFHPVGALLGTRPDWRGIRIVEQHRETILTEREYITARGIAPTTVAASIAVQSQWNGFPVDYILGGLDYILHGKDASPSFGIGQLTQKQLEKWGIAGTPFQSDVSVKGMTERIAEAVNACKKCNDTDKLIIAAMAQNGGFNKNNVKELVGNKDYQEDYGINWEKYFRDQERLSGHPWSDWFNNIRAYQQNYNTQYMLRLFTNDLQVLVEQKGWEAPPGYDPDYLQCLANGDKDCKPTNP